MQISSLEGMRLELVNAEISMVYPGFGERRLRFSYDAVANRLTNSDCRDVGSSAREWSAFGGNLRYLRFGLAVPFEIQVANGAVSGSKTWDVSMNLQGDRLGSSSCRLDLSVERSSGSYLSPIVPFDARRGRISGLIWKLEQGQNRLQSVFVRTASGYDLYFEGEGSSGSVIAKFTFKSIEVMPVAPAPAPQQREEAPVEQRRQVDAPDPSLTPAPEPEPEPNRPIVRVPTKPVIIEMPRSEVSRPGSIQVDPPPHIEVQPDEIDLYLNSAEVTCADPSDCPDYVGMLIGADDQGRVYLCSATKVSQDEVFTNAHCLPQYRSGGRLFILYPQTSTRPAQREEVSSFSSNHVSSDPRQNKDFARIRIHQPVDRGFAPVSDEKFLGQQALHLWAVDPVTDKPGLNGRIVHKTCNVVEDPIYRRFPEIEVGNYPLLELKDCSPELVRGNSGSALIEMSGGRPLIKGLLSAGAFGGRSSARSGIGPSARCFNRGDWGYWSRWNRGICQFVSRNEVARISSPEYVANQLRSDLSEALGERSNFAYRSTPVHRGDFSLHGEKQLVESVFRGQFRVERQYRESKGAVGVQLPGGSQVFVSDAVVRMSVDLHLNPECVPPVDLLHRFRGETATNRIEGWANQFRTDYSLLPESVSPIGFQNPARMQATARWFRVTVSIKVPADGVIRLGNVEYEHSVERFDTRIEVSVSDYAEQRSGSWWPNRTGIRATWRSFDSQTNQLILEASKTSCELRQR